MSKLAVIKSQYRAGGDIFSGIAGLVGKGMKAIGSLLGGGGGAAKVVQVAKKAAPIVAGGVAGKLLAGGGGGGGSMSSSGGRRRSRGITARELRGYHKVARLLHREGMVSRHARGRH